MDGPGAVGAGVVGAGVVRACMIREAWSGQPERAGWSRPRAAGVVGMERPGRDVEANAESGSSTFQ